MPRQNNVALPPGYQLETYTVKAQLSMGGFSIVYLVEDEDEREYAVKEYLPNNLALRKEGESAPQILEEHQTVFRYGMKCFFVEGRALAAMNHPNVIRVVNFFRANNTVYMVMEYVEGRSLHEVVYSQPDQISERYMRGVFARVLNGLREVHSHRLLHLDLKPSNIYMRQDKIPLLIDFGAARQMLMREKNILKPMYTPGFASPEHYGRLEDVGPWSDIYGIGASMYALLGRKTPQAANERLKKDELVPARRRWSQDYSPKLLELIDWCMELDYLNRPQSVYSLQKLLIEDAPPLSSDRRKKSSRSRHLGSSRSSRDSKISSATGRWLGHWFGKSSYPNR